MMDILPYGDSAMLINFEQRISREIHRAVVRCRVILADIAGVISIIPAYASITVVFDPKVISFDELRSVALTIQSPEILSEPEGRVIEIPVCYEPDFAPDLHGLAVQIGKTEEEIVSTHSSTEFYVYMIGFMPGFGYMGDMPTDFACHRRPVPRTRVARGSVGLAGLQTAIYPFDSPGGWQLIGRTPLVMFDPARDEPNLLRAGDKVKFFRISPDEFQSIKS